MAYGSQPAAPSQYNPEDFLYFCPDASKRPIKGEPCIWAARPWPGYVIMTSRLFSIVYHIGQFFSCTALKLKTITHNICFWFLDT